MSAKTCRRGHDLTLPEAVIYRRCGKKGSGKARMCRACARAASRKYRKSAKGRLVREAYDEGRVKPAIAFPADVWMEFLQNVGTRNATRTLLAMIKAANERARKLRLMVG